MKKKVLFFILFNTLCLSSCSFHSNRRTDVFFECSFSLTQEEITYYFEVTNIDYETFIAANDKNVVEDDVTKNSNLKYYSISFYSQKQNEEDAVRYNFYNLHPQTKAITQPISYTDDFGHCISPCSVFRGHKGNLSYIVSYHSLYLTFGNNLSEDTVEEE